MDNEPESGPSKKPQRPAARPATGGQKPSPGAKPTSKPSATPIAKPTAKPTMKRVAKPAVVSDSGNGVPSVSEQLESPARPSVPRLSVARLNLPKIGLPKLAIPSLGLRTPPAVEAETDTAAGAETEAAAEVVAEAETELAAEVVPEAETEPQSEAETAAEVSEPDATVADASASAASIVLSVRGLTKSFDYKVAVDGIDLDVHVGAFYGIVGPNGAGKTTTLSMITGLLRPTAGSIVVNGADVWSDPVVAKRTMGVLPDRLRLFDRLTGSQVLYYAGVLRGLDAETVRKRTADLAQAFGLEEALGRLVSDYSAGMTKKIALAAAMIHTPRLLVLDEPFESVDPVSAATVTEILKNYVAFGGTVVLSSHSMDLVQRICDHVAVIVNGVILADGTMAHVRNGLTLEDRFVELAGGRKTVEGLEWLHTFSD